MDATHLKGEIVALKRINPTLHPSEGVIARYFSSNNRRSIRNNHCVPLLDVLHVPQSDKQDGTPIILVMPFLVPYNNPTFATVGEAVGFIKQAIEVREDPRGLHNRAKRVFLGCLLHAS